MSDNLIEKTGTIRFAVSELKNSTLGSDSGLGSSTETSQVNEQLVAENLSQHRVSHFSSIAGSALHIG